MQWTGQDDQFRTRTHARMLRRQGLRRPESQAACPRLPFCFWSLTVRALLIFFRGVLLLLLRAGCILCSLSSREWQLLMERKARPDVRIFFFDRFTAGITRVEEARNEEDGFLFHYLFFSCLVLTYQRNDKKLSDNFQRERERETACRDNSHTCISHYANGLHN